VTSQNQSPASGLRVSDADRDAVAAELSEHLRVGRLQLEEFGERVGQALGAKTRGDLDRLLTDLPRPLPPPPPVSRRPGLPFPLIAAMIFVVGMAVLGGIGHAATATGHGHPGWPFLFLWWLIPLTIFAARRLRRAAPTG
jgi:uncharacterized protein DUF1707